MSAYTGQLAALATSLLFATTSTVFTLAGRQVGSMVLNRIRLLLAIVLLLIAHWLFHIPLPFAAPAYRWFWLGLSGVIGLSLGDAFLFQSYIWIGPRLGMLLMALAPMIAALFAGVFLHEALSPGQVFGMLLTLAGVGWVVLDGRARGVVGAADRRHYLLGLLFGLLAATGQALGLVTAKLGAGDGFPALSGTLIRMICAALVVWLYTLFRRQSGETFAQLRAHPKAIRFILIGAFAGPFLGVTLSLVAIQNTEVGIASTLMALPPIILLPVGYFMFNDRFGWRAIAGTLTAIAGVALLFMV